MSRTPVTIAFAVLVGVVCMIAGVSLIQQAFTGKPQPGKSKIKNFIQEILFRLRFALGLVLVILVMAGVGWALIFW